MKTAKERKEQNGKDNKVSVGDGSSTENKQYDKDGQCDVTIAGHKNHKCKVCKYNKESSNYCGSHWKKDMEDGKAIKKNPNKDDKKDISKKTANKKDEEVNLTKEPTPHSNQRVCFASHLKVKVK